MATPSHEVPLVLLHQHPEWVGLLVRILTGYELPPDLIPMDSSVRVVDPAEVRPDLVLVSPSAWALVEIQLDRDEEKRWRWPLAMAAVSNERRAPGDLIVITPSRAVAEWAREVSVQAGSLGTTLTLSPHVVAVTGDVAGRLLDPERPELAFFAAWAMNNRYGPKAREVVERAVSLVDTLGELELRERLLRSILDVLDERMIEVLKQMVMNPTNPATENPALRRLVDEFAARFGPELKAEGRAEGRAEGKAEGRAEGKAEDIVRVLVARGVVLEESARIRVLACRDLALLDRWFDQALTLAPSAVFDPDA